MLETFKAHSSGTNFTTLRSLLSILAKIWQWLERVGSDLPWGVVGPCFSATWLLRRTVFFFLFLFNRSTCGTHWGSVRKEGERERYRPIVPSGGFYCSCRFY
jgi:hypothetical protein